MKHTIKIAIAVLLLCLTHLTAWADEWPKSGACGEYSTCTLTEDGTLTISGTGETEYRPDEISEQSIYDRIKNVVVNEGITSISAYLFLGCANVRTVQLPSSLLRIDNSAFSDCSSLESINFPSGLESIGEYAFYRCGNLDNVYLPEGVTVIEECLFGSCTSLSNFQMAPTVTYIGKNAFEETAIENIEMPNVEYIGSYAFSGCRRLSSVAIPSKVDMLNVHTFAYCDELQYITISKGVSVLYSDVFYSDNYIDRDIYINGRYNSLQEFYDAECENNGGVFYRTNPLPALFASGVCNDNGEWTLDEDSTLTISGNGVLEHFGGGGFDEISVKTIVINEGKVGIADNRFSRFANVQTVQLPSSLSSIGSNAFSNCFSLESINFPSGLTSIGEAAFSGCGKLNNVELPDGITEIANDTFQGCAALTNFKMQPTVTSIGDEAFFESGIERIDMDSVESIGGRAFGDCKNLLSISIPRKITTLTGGFAYGCTSLREITIHKGVKRIGTGSFGTSEPLDIDRIINGRYSTIEEFFDAECELDRDSPYDYLRTNPLPTIIASGICGEKAGWTLDEDGTLTISGTGMLVYPTEPEYDEKSVKNIVVEEGVTDLGSFIFQGYENLVSAGLPGTMSVLADNAFRSCLNLGEVILPENMTAIGEYAFAHCESLSGISLPDSLETIGESAFADCVALQSFVVPEKVTTIQNATFSNCTSLMSVIIGENVDRIYLAWFENAPEDIVVNGEYVGIDSFLTDAGFVLDTESDCWYVRKNSSPTEFAGPSAGSVAVSTEKYCLNGVKAVGGNGLRVVRRQYSDGTVKSSLQIVR